MSHLGVIGLIAFQHAASTLVWFLISNVTFLESCEYPYGTAVNRTYFCGNCVEKNSVDSMCQIATQYGDCVRGSEYLYADAGGKNWCEGELKGVSTNFTIGV